MELNRNPYLAVSQEDPSAFLRLALQAALASGATDLKMQADSHVLNLPFQPDSALPWGMEQLEQVKEQLEGRSGLGLEPAYQKAAIACALTACRPDLRLKLSVPGVGKCLEVDEQGFRWGNADPPPQACCFAFSRHGERPGAEPGNALLDFFSAPLARPWPELFDLKDLLFDSPTKVSVNGTALGKLTLDPQEDLEPESIELFRLAIVHPDRRLNNLKVIAQTRTIAHSRSVIEAVLHPLIFACVTPEGEPVNTTPGSTVRAWAALTLHEEPLQYNQPDGAYGAHHWEIDHILRILQYGISVARTRTGVSPRTRVILDGSELETDLAGRNVVDLAAVTQKVLGVKSLYQLACRIWQRELDHPKGGWENLKLGLHRSVLKEFEATLPTLG